MSFTPEQPKTPSSIGDISVVITDIEGGSGSVNYEVQILQADGSIFKLVSGNLVPHLSAGQIAIIQTFMADIRTKAQALLP